MMWWHRRELDYELRNIHRELRRIWEVILSLEFRDAELFLSRLETPMVAQNPGNTIVVTFKPVPADATLTSPPVITSSDTTNAPVTADPTGLIASVTFPTTAAPGAYTLSINYTNPDGTTASGSFAGEIVAPVVDVTSFTAEQTT